MGHHAEVQYQCKFSSHHSAALRQCYRYSSEKWQHGRMVQNNSRRKEIMSSVTHSLQHFFNQIMPDALEERDGKVSIGDRNITNLRFADDIDTPAEEEQELFDTLDKTCT